MGEGTPVSRSSSSRPEPVSLGAFSGATLRITSHLGLSPANSKPLTPSYFSSCHVSRFTTVTALCNVLSDFSASSDSSSVGKVVKASQLPSADSWTGPVVANEKVLPPPLGSPMGNRCS